MKEFIIELKVIKVFSVKNYKRYPTHTKKMLSWRRKHSKLGIRWFKKSLRILHWLAVYSCENLGPSCYSFVKCMQSSSILACSGCYNKNTIDLEVYKQQKFISHNSGAQKPRTICC